MATTRTTRSMRPAGVRVVLAWRRFRQGWSIFSRNPLALIGIGVLAFFLLLALAHPLMFEMGLWTRDIYHPETGGDFEVFPRPSGTVPGHLLGVDTLGRDNLSRLMAATGPAFTLAIAVAISTAFFSVLIGAFSAYYRGWLDFVFTHLADILLLLPAPLAMIVLSARFYEQFTSVSFGILYGFLTGAGAAAVVMRAQALLLMESPFIEAARVSGGRPLYIIPRHLIPNMLPLAFAQMMTSVVGAIVADGFIAFLGYRRIRLSWGLMVYEGFGWMRLVPDVPWAAILAPALSLSLFAAAFYFISRGLHDVADPRLQGRGAGWTPEDARPDAARDAAQA